jgi:hypothetical protein
MSARARCCESNQPSNLNHDWLIVVITIPEPDPGDRLRQWTPESGADVSGLCALHDSRGGNALTGTIGVPKTFDLPRGCDG